MAAFRRRRAALSATAIAFGILVLVSVPAGFGPSLPVGLLLGGSFIIYGGIRLYRALRT